MYELIALAVQVADDNVGSSLDQLHNFTENEDLLLISEVSLASQNSQKFGPHNNFLLYSMNYS